MRTEWIGDYLFFRSRIDNTKQVLVDVDDNMKGYTYGELNTRANKLANVIKQLGLKKGDRVAFISRNRIELIDAYYATGKTGTVLVPYNARLSADELANLVKSEQPAVLFFEDIFEKSLVRIKQEGLVKHLVVLKNSDAESQYDSYDQLMDKSPDTPVNCPELDMEDIHLIIHTGGTTGLPKGGLVSFRNELFNSFNEICTWGLNHEDKTLLLLPMFHTGGWQLLTLPLLHVGGTLYFNRQYDPGKTLALTQSEGFTCLFGAATIFRMMVEHPDFAKADLSSLKWMMAGAAPTPINIMEEFWNRGIKFVLGYGMTEAGPNNLSAPPQFITDEVMRAKYASVGKPMYLTLVKLVDDNGNEVTTPNTPGELLWSGPQIFNGYWNNEEATDETLVDGWVHTGDMATFDEDGFYYIVGRKKNMFISGGENVFPPEVENVLYQIEEIKECCVFGVPDEKWGEVGKAVISLKPGQHITKEAIVDYLNQHISRYKIPKHYQFVDDVPKNNVGKIVVSKVMELYGKTDA